MVLPSLASVDDFADWLGVDIDNQERAEAILTAASTLVRSTSGRAWVDADGNPEDGLTETQIDAAHTAVLLVTQRVWNNPYGVTQETTGPFSKSVAAWAAMGLELTDVEKQLISIGDDGSTIPGLSSIRLVAPAQARGSRLFDPEWWEADEDEEDDDDEGS